MRFLKRFIPLLTLLLACGCPPISDCILVDPDIEQPDLWNWTDFTLAWEPPGRFVSIPGHESGGVFWSDVTTIPIEELLEMLPGKYLLYKVTAYVEEGLLTLEFWHMDMGHLETATFAPKGKEFEYMYLWKYIEGAADIPTVSEDFVGYIERFDVRIVTPYAEE